MSQGKAKRVKKEEFLKMKRTRKTAAFLLALAVGAAAAAPAFAEGDGTTELSWQTVFDATTYNYADATAIVTPITTIWTDWSVSGGGSALYSCYGHVNGMSVRPANNPESGDPLTITSPDLAEDADAFKIEFVLGCGTNYFDTMVYDADSEPIFSYDYGSSTGGFFPRVAYRSFGEGVPIHIKSEPAEDALKDRYGSVYTTFTNDKSVMTITVENKNGAVENSNHTEGDYYVVTYNCDGKDFDKEYYKGRANGFGGISCFKNGNGADCVYAQLKIYELTDKKYVARSGDRYFETLDEAIDAVGKPWNREGSYATIELLKDAEITKAHTENNDGKTYLRAYINGNGHTINVTSSAKSLETITLNDVTLTGGVGGIGNNLTDYPGVDGTKTAWDNVKLDNMVGDCLILNQGQIANCTITNYSGVSIFPNNIGSNNLILNTTITSTSVDPEFPAVRVNVDNNFTIEDSTITGTKTGGTSTNDVTIVNGTLTVKGNTTIGLMSKTGSGSLTFDNFTGNATLDSSFGTEVGTEIAAVTGGFTGTVTLNGLDENCELKVAEGKLIVAEKAPEKATATLETAAWESTDEEYTVDSENTNELTALDGTVVYGYKATFDDLGNVTYTKAVANVTNAETKATQMQDKNIAGITTEGGVVFYIISDAALDTGASTIVLE